jgi:predicted ferric reductase
VSISLDGPGLWYATRATGLVALVLLTVAVLLGVLTAGRLTSPRWPGFLTLGLHRNVALLATVFLAGHVTTTVLDTFTAIPVSAVFVPLLSPYRPAWTGLGAVALDLLAAVTVTSLMRGRLGYRAWRLVHWASYGCWAAAVVHAAGTGTDAHQPWAAGLGAGCVTAVAAAAAWRLLQRWPERRMLRLGLIAVTVAGVPAALALGGYA